MRPARLWAKVLGYASHALPKLRQFADATISIDSDHRGEASFTALVRTRKVPQRGELHQGTAYTATGAGERQASPQQRPDSKGFSERLASPRNGVSQGGGRGEASFTPLKAPRYLQRVSGRAGTIMGALRSAPASLVAGCGSWGHPGRHPK